MRYAPNPAGNSMSQEVERDEATHPRQHALAMASATHLLKMGHIDQGTHAKIHKSAAAALGKSKKQPMGPAMPGPADMQQQQPAPFGSFAPR